MNIILVGVGKISNNLVRSLSKYGHSITIIDLNKDVLKQIIDEVDCMGIVGNSVVKSVLEDANINSTDVLIATTASDEINMLTCLLANKFNNLKTIARIRNPEYTNEINYLKEQLKLSYTINPELATANEIYNILKYSSAISNDSFFKNKINLLKILVNEHSALCGTKLYEVQNKFNCNLVVCVIERDNEIIIPKGNDTINANDKISFFADITNVIKFFKHAELNYAPIKSILIVGGGKITYYLISVLNDINCSVKVIDKDKKVCEGLLEKFPNVSVVCADGSDKRVLLQEGIKDVDAFLSLTGIDEENIILSLFAKKTCNTKIFTKINRTNFSEVIKELDIGIVINPELICSDIITKQVRSIESTKDNNIEKYTSLCDNQVEGLEFYINDNSKITNTKIKDLNIKKDILLACILRNNNIIIPNGNEIIKKNDNVIIISKNNKINDINEILE